MSNRPKRQVPSSTKVAAAAATGSGRTPVWIWVAIGAAVLVALAAAVAFTRGDETVTTSAGEEVEAIVYGEPALQSEALPQLPRGGTDPAVGMQAPSIEGQDLAGEPMTIDTGDGRPKVVMFLAHWCPHCQAEVPRLTEWVEANGLPDDVDLYSVATSTDDTQPNYPPGDWLLGEGWPVDVLVDDQQGTAAMGYGLTGFPFFVVIDADGNVVERTSGELSVEQWEALIEAARTGQSAGAAGGASSPG